MQAALAGGGVPFFVGATSGSTVLGAFDPLVDLAKASAWAENEQSCRLCVVLICGSAHCWCVRVPTPKTCINALAA